VIQYSVRAVLREDTQAETATETLPPTTELNALAAVQPSASPTVTLTELLTQNSDITTNYYFRKISSTTPLVQNPDTSMVAASVPKLITATYAFRQIDAGNLSLTRNLGDFDVEWQLDQLLRQSNNISLELFFTLFGRDSIRSFAKNDLGLASYDIDSNMLSAGDAASILERLYTGTLLSEKSTGMMLSFLQNTYNETYIPAALNPDDSVYHKVGEYEDFVHDASVIVRNGEPYLLVIMTSGNGYPDYPRRTQYLRDLTRAFLEGSN